MAADVGTEADDVRPVAPADERILVAAKELFLTVGFPSTSMEMIAKRARVVRATIYNNFADKEAILSALMRDYLLGYAAIPARLRTRVKLEQDSFQIMESIVREAFMWRLDNSDLRPLIDISEHLANSAWKEHNAAADEAIRHLFLKIHRQDARRGLIRDDVNLEFATYALYGMIESVLSTFDVHAKPARVTAAIRDLTSLHWHAIYKVAPGEAATAT